PEPMPLCMVHRVIVHAARHAECPTEIGAAHHHHVGPGGKADGLCAGENINISVCASARTIDGKINLSDNSYRIDRLARNDVAAKINLPNDIESRRDGGVLRVRRAYAPDLVRV